MLKPTASEARGAQKESEREEERQRMGGRGRQYKWGGWQKRNEMGMEGAADPLHPAEAAVFTSLTCSLHTHSCRHAVFPLIYTQRHTNTQIIAFPFILAPLLGETQTDTPSFVPFTPTAACVRIEMGESEWVKSNLEKGVVLSQGEEMMRGAGADEMHSEGHSDCRTCASHWEGERRAETKRERERLPARIRGHCLIIQRRWLYLQSITAVAKPRRQKPQNQKDKCYVMWERFIWGKKRKGPMHNSEEMTTPALQWIRDMRAGSEDPISKLCAVKKENATAIK